MLKTSNTKKVVVGVLALAMVFSFSFSIAGADTMTTTTTTSTTTLSAPYTFSSNLTVGSTGPDVVALQTFLVAHGFLVMPAGVAMGYFGNLTRAAVAAFQASVGISPSVGYFGPITRAYLAAHPELFGAASGSTTCPAGYTCTAQNTGVTCPAGYTCTPIGGGSTTGSGSTAEGVLTVTLGPPGGNSNIQTNTDVPVYGLNVKAQLGDIRIDQLDLDVNDTVSGGSQENPGAFINNIKVWDGSTVLMSRNVSTADFVTGTSSTDYHILLSGLNFMVPANTQKTLTVSFSTSGSIDNSRTLTIRGFNSTSLRYFTYSNVANYADISGTGFTVTQTFVKPGTASVITGVDASNPLSMTNYIDPNSTVYVPLLVFDVNNTQGSSVVSQVNATITTNSTGTYPTAVELWQGGTQLSYKTVASTSQAVVFDNLQNFAQGTGNVFTIKADMPNNTATGTIVTAQVTSVTYQNSNGTTNSVNTTITGNAQHFYPATPQLAFVSGTAQDIQNSQTGTSTNEQATFTFTVTPKPGQEVQPIASDFTVRASTSTATASNLYAPNSQTITITPTPTNNVLSAGQTYTITLNASWTGANLPATGFYTYYMTSASTTVQDYHGVNVPIVQTWGLDNFKTNSTYFVR